MIRVKYTKAILQKIPRPVMEFRFIQMATFILGNFKITKSTEKANFTGSISLPRSSRRQNMFNFLAERGGEDFLMAMDLTKRPQGISMKVNSKMVSNMEKGNSTFLTGILIKENM